MTESQKTLKQQHTELQAQIQDAIARRNEAQNTIADLERKITASGDMSLASRLSELKTTVQMWAKRIAHLRSNQDAVEHELTLVEYERLAREGRETLLDRNEAQVTIDNLTETIQQLAAQRSELDSEARTIRGRMAKLKETLPNRPPHELYKIRATRIAAKYALTYKETRQ